MQFDKVQLASAGHMVEDGLSCDRERVEFLVVGRSSSLPGGSFIVKKLKHGAVVVK